MSEKWNLLIISIILGCLLCSLPASAFTITASAGNKGSIEPSGVITADAGSSLSFAITPDTGYLVNEVVIDGISQGNISAFTFSEIALDHKIDATFMPDLTGTETLITTEPLQLNQDSPCIDGDNIVWQDSFADVMLYNVVTGNERVLRPQGDENGFANPVISGNLVAWEEQNATDLGMDITLYDISRSAVIASITGPPGSDQLHPSIDGNRIVWEDSRNGDSDIYLFDVTTQNENPIVTGPENTYQINPAISGDYVVWQDFRNGTSDIFLYDLRSSVEILVTEGPPDSAQTSPAISGDLVVWQDSRNGDDDIYAYNISARTETLLSISTETTNQRNPAISGSTVVWEDGRGFSSTVNIFLYDIPTGAVKAISSYPSEQISPAIHAHRLAWTDSRQGNTDIFLFTIGESQTCPVAGFTENVVTGDVPLTVQFTDTSGDGPKIYHWEFGDGATSSERDPLYTYMVPGRYTVTLTISNPSCRNAFSAPDLISAQIIPHANFSANRTSGYQPAAIEFSDRSTGSPSEWSWDFGDGGVSYEENPTHMYEEGGCYTVNLTVSNAYGADTHNEFRYITVMNRMSRPLSLNIAGLEISVEDARQSVLFNSSTGTEYRTDQDNTTLELFPPAETGIRRIQFCASDPPGFTRLDTGDVAGNFSRVLIDSNVSQVKSTGPCTGCPIQYSMNMSSYPQNGVVSVYSWGGAVPEDEEILSRTIFYAGFSGVNDVAYEIALNPSSIDDTGHVQINMSANSSWVQENGGVQSIWVVRITDDVAEVLPAAFLFHDQGTNRDFFSVESPRGMSRFVLTSLFGTGNPFQLLMYKLISLFATPAPLDTSGGDWPTATSTPGITPRYNPPSEIPTIIVTPGPAGRSGNLPLDGGGSVASTITIESADGLVQVDIPAGTRVSDVAGYPVDQVSLIGPFVPSLPPVQYIAGSIDTGIFYSIFPSGTTYNPPVNVTITISRMQWDSAMEYHVWQYDGLTSQWIELPSTLSPGNRTISFSTSKSGIVTVMKNPLPSTPMAERDSTGPKGAMRPGSDQVSIFSGMIVWLGEQLARFFSFAIIGVVAIATAVFFLKRRKYRRQ